MNKKTRQLLCPKHLHVHFFCNIISHRGSFLLNGTSQTHILYVFLLWLSVFLSSVECAATLLLK